MRLALHRKPALEDLGDYDAYDEYVRGFDDVPTLRDAVTAPPSPPPDFRRGERPDLRRDARPDHHAHRESQTTELEIVYREYVEALASPPKLPKAPRAPKSRKPRKRKRR
jgi:hypothetical protein